MSLPVPGHQLLPIGFVPVGAMGPLSILGVQQVPSVSFKQEAGSQSHQVQDSSHTGQGQ